jgi:twinkle protein
MYYDKLCDLGIKLSRRNGSEKTKCPQCSDSRKNKADKPLSVNITTGEWNCHNCGWKGNVRKVDRKRENKTYERPDANMVANIALKEKTQQWLLKRGLNQSTIDKFMIFS